MPKHVGKLFEVRGDKAVSDALARLGPELRIRAVPAALRYAGKVIVEKAQRFAPVASGLLRNSLGLVLRGKRNQPRYAAIGARTGFGTTVFRDGREVYSDPAKYAHLVEFGTGRGAPAQPFLRPAIEGSRDEVRQRFITSLERAQAREARRLAKQ